MKNKYSVLVFTLVIAFSLFYINITLNGLVRAAEPGCYAKSVTSSTNVVYDKADCPLNNESISEGVNSGLCYVASVSPSRGLGSFSQQDCNSFNQGDNQVGSTTITQNDEGGTDRSSFSGGECEASDGEKLNADNCGIIRLTVYGINFLSALAGIAIIASLMIAGFTYMTAQDDPGKVQKSRTRIVQTLIALVLFIFMYALLNFLVPGGVLP